jgi:LCP family protein required for cell wall assembly
LLELEEKRGLWKRLLFGTLAVVVFTAAATAITLFNEVDRLAKAFRHNLPGLGEDLAQAPPGKPQTLLLIGSDERVKTARDAGGGARSDTMILVRLDPARDAISLLSLPRDLKVRIPGHGVDKLNAAYAEGGPRLTLKTIKDFTGLTVNHVINVDFRGFEKAVNAIHCVYADIDRRYYNDNASGENYAVIDIDPGYQKLCGHDALDYVRYRHTDTDIVRAARQQDFLRQAKSQIGARRLFGDQDKLVKIVGRYTRSDINGRKQVLTLIKLAVGSAGAPVREIHFPAQIGASYVTASQSAVHKVTREFLGTDQPVKAKRKKPKIEKGSPADLMDVRSIGKEQALKVAGEVRGMRIYYPRVLMKGSSFSVNSPRAYRICGPHGRCWASYRMVFATNRIGEFYGLQGTRWMDPPILRSPDVKKKIGGREFDLYFDGKRLRMVAWREGDAVYWVTNTLLQSIPRSDLMSIARATKPL